MDDISKYNRVAWNGASNTNLREWTMPIKSEFIENAKKGNIKIKLTPKKYVPKSWFPELNDKNILCLASGGGQQGPILAAAGAKVVVIDNSDNQIKNDQFVAERENLEMKTIVGDIRDLSMFESNYFDIIINLGVGHFENFIPVWNEIGRITKINGILMSGITNPIQYIFDYKDWNNNKLNVRHKIPYSDMRDLTEEEKKELIYDTGEPMFFSDTLEDLIQGQINAGFIIEGFYEDISGGPLDKYINSCFATKSKKIRNVL